MEQKVNNEMKIELKEEIAKGVYSNLAILTHSSSEFVVDFAQVLPGLAKANVQSRVILSPEHAKRLLMALQENIRKYESVFGPIQMPEQTTIAPLGVKGEA